MNSQKEASSQELQKQTGNEKPPKLRLNKYLADLGIDARRKIDEMIAEGRIAVNGEQIRKPGVQIVPGEDFIKIDNKPLSTKEQKKRYLLLYKPKGVITSRSDDKHRKTVYDYLPNVKERLFPVGRLDYNTEGALLMTNDGDLAYRLAHPSSLIMKQYQAKVSGTPDRSDLAFMQKKLAEASRGWKVPKHLMQSVHIVESEGKNAWLEFKMYEGKNREIRQLCESVYHPVLKLKRVKYAFLGLGKMPAGSVRMLHQYEIDKLNSIVEKSKATKKTAACRRHKGAESASVKRTGAKGKTKRDIKR